jgi:succinate dehydrogenase/fumarate reductase-like Fe-S protein
MKWIVNLACSFLGNARDCHDSLKAEELHADIVKSNICHLMTARLPKIELEYLPEFAIVRACIVDISDLLARAVEQWKAYYDSKENTTMEHSEHTKRTALRLMSLMRSRAKEVFDNELKTLYERVNKVSKT